MAVPAFADEFFLSNTTAGLDFNDRQFTFFKQDSETSVIAASSTNQPGVGPMDRNGRVIGLFIGVSRAALSASGFVSATIDADLRINSGANIMTTKPSIVMLAASATVALQRVATNYVSAHSAATAGVVNAASGVFSAGDMLEFDYNARSVGSAVPGLTQTGIYIGVTVRFANQ